MPVRRREIELSVERSIGPADEPSAVVRLTARIEPEGTGSTPPLPEMKATLQELLRELDSLLGPAPRTVLSGRPERGLAELVETYRPRQRELIDLLREEGELTDSEHSLLAAHLPEGGAPVSRPVPRPPERAAESARASEPPASPILPVPAERGLPAARPVPELLRTYQITTLRQAGAVRARRQISFAEYMALKRHFESSEHPTGTGSGTSSA